MHFFIYKDCIWFFFLKGGSSNLSLDKIESVVAFKTKLFVSVSNVVQPNKRVWAIKESGDSHILQSMLFKVLRTTCLALLNLRQWRRK